MCVDSKLLKIERKKLYLHYFLFINVKLFIKNFDEVIVSTFCTHSERFIKLFTKCDVFSWNFPQETKRVFPNTPPLKVPNKVSPNFSAREYIMQFSSGARFPLFFSLYLLFHVSRIRIEFKRPPPPAFHDSSVHINLFLN